MKAFSSPHFFLFVFRDFLTFSVLFSPSATKERLSRFCLVNIFFMLASAISQSNDTKSRIAFEKGIFRAIFLINSFFFYVAE